MATVGETSLATRREAVPAALPVVRPLPAVEPAVPREEIFELGSGTSRVRWPVGIPLALLAVISVLFRWTSLDLTIAALFYDSHEQLWPWFNSPVCTWFYRRGIFPAVGLAVVAGLWLVYGLWRRHPRTALQSSVFLLAVFAIGPGLIVNWGLKASWGRPRPHQVQQFGGDYAFLPVGTPGQIDTNSSFPSGHAAVAFYLIAPAFLIDERRRRLAHAMMFAALAFGFAMGAVRVVQGGHFASDVIWSAAIVYFTCAVMAGVILRPVRRRRNATLRAV